MINKIKAMGLAFVAITAMSAMAASAAQAGTLQVGATPAVITGHSDPKPLEPTKFQEHILSIKKTGAVHETFPAICNTASFEGTTQGQVLHEATVTPTYGSSQVAPTGCTLFGQAAQVKVNGCKYTLTGKYLEGGVEVSPANTAKIDIVGCTVATPYIQIKSALCEVRIPQQNGLSHIVGTNIGGANKEVTLNATVSGITITQIGAACPDGNNHHSTNGSFTGNTIAKAFKDGGTKEVEKHGHKYLENICGEQVTLISS